MKKVVLSGGPYSGKTTIIEQLAQLGYTTIPEVAIEIIQANPDLRKVDQFAFQSMVVEEQIQREQAVSTTGGQPVFLDRSIIDSVAYCILRGIEQPQGLDAACRASDYHSIFILDTLSTFDTRAESGRTSTYEISVRARDLLVDAYNTYGYTVVSVPEMSVDKRIEMILSDVLGYKDNVKQF